MTRFRIFLISALVTLAALAAVAPSASAQAQTQAHGSCVGVLSAFAGSQQGDPFFRQDFAPLPGGLISGLAQEKGNLLFCGGFIGLP